MNLVKSARQRSSATNVIAAIGACLLFAGSVEGQIVASTVDTNASAGGLEEIVVTATRREERLQDVPISLSVASGEQLQATGFKDLTDIQYVLPGVYFGESPNDQGFRLRGVGTAGGYSSASEQNVGLVIDGVVVPFGNPIASLGDVERVEALKGPQGTQFGKNASSGVISVITPRPDLTKIEGEVFGSYGSLDERDLHGGINLPISSTAAAEIYAFDRGYDGFIFNQIQHREWGGSRSDGVRGKLLWQPAGNFTAYLIADYSTISTDGPQQLWTLRALSPTYDPFFHSPFVNLAALGVTPGANNQISVDDYSGNGRVANYGTSLELDLDIGGYTLTSVSAYRGMLTYSADFSIDATPLPRFEAQNMAGRNRFISEEMRLTSPKGETLEYVAGAYLSKLLRNA
jgi:iron complex outermembrane receptor protein